MISPPARPILGRSTSRTISTGRGRWLYKGRDLQQVVLRRRARRRGRGSRGPRMLSAEQARNETACVSAGPAGPLLRAANSPMLGTLLRSSPLSSARAQASYLLELAPPRRALLEGQCL